MEYRFTLTSSGVDTLVDQPQGFESFLSEIKRDFKAHGAIYKFTSGTLKLGFADGRDILETAFQTYGFDAIVTLTIDKRPDQFTVYTNLFVGNAIMKNREYNDIYFSVDFESSTYQQKVINRLKTKVRLDATIDLDGNPLVGSLTSFTALWNTIRLNEDFISDYKTGGNSTLKRTFSKNDTFTTGTTFFQTIKVNYDGIIRNEISEFFTITEVIEKGQTLTIADKNLIMNKGGDLTVSASDIKFQVSGTITTTGDDQIDFYARWKLRHENNAGVFKDEQTIHEYSVGLTETTSLVFDSGITSDNFTSKTFNNVVSSDLIYIYLELEAFLPTAISGDTVTMNTTYDLYENTQIDLKLLKFSTTKTVKSYLVFDVINWILYIISGRKNTLQSDFLNVTENGASVDGCGSLNMITNGAQLRGIDNALEMSLSEVIDSVIAIYGAGWGFEKNYNNEYDLRFELVEYFYSDGEILDLGNPVSIKELDSYEETSFDDLIFNKIVLGYKKFSSDEDITGDLDDFLTKAEYSLPSETISGEYTRISELITSGRLIQATFEQTDLTKAWKYDNNNFIVAAVRSASVFIPENDQNFVSVTGIDDSSTAYNIRHAPVYMLLNNALLINSSLFGKSLSELIQNTNVEINKDFTAQFDPSETCLLGDNQRLVRGSSLNITIGDNYEGLRLFNPIVHELTVAMTADQLNTIIDALENNADDPDKNYGYLTYTNDDGDIKTGYPIKDSIKWNPIDEIAEIKTLEKADNYGL